MKQTVKRVAGAAGMLVLNLGVLGVVLGSGGCSKEDPTVSAAPVTTPKPGASAAAPPKAVVKDVQMQTLGADGQAQPPPGTAKK